MTYIDDNPKTVHGDAKPPLHLVPATGTLHEAMAFADGAKKYGAYNWREKTVSSTTYLGAAKRHIDSWFNGEDTDPVSGVHHLGHARACLNIILDAQAVGNLNDNRPPKAPIAELIRTLTKPLEKMDLRAPLDSLVIRLNVDDLDGEVPAPTPKVPLGAFTLGGEWHPNEKLEMSPDAQFDYMVQKGLVCSRCLKMPSACQCAMEATEEDLDPLCPVCPGGKGKPHAGWCGGVE